MTDTPITCHHTLIPLMRATRWLPAMFSTVCSARITRKRANVPLRKSPLTALKRLTSYRPSTVLPKVAAP